MIVPFGEAALRIDLPDEMSRLALRVALLSVPGVREVVLSERHALVTFDPREPPVDLEDAVVAASAVRDGLSPSQMHLVRVRYDGPDLARVAERSHLSVSDVIRLHVEREYTVRVVGFLPGFAYLAEVDPRIAVARLPSPRPRVPALSVGLAGGAPASIRAHRPGAGTCWGPRWGSRPSTPSAEQRSRRGTA